MKTRLKATLLLIFTLCIVLVSASCKKEYYTQDEIKDILIDLVSRSEELNVIYFGEGLPFSSDEETMKNFYEMFDSDLESINYEPVSESCGYSSEEDIKEATRAVFTEDYSEFLFSRAFAGLSDVLPDESGNEITTNAVYARYIEQNGILTQRIGVSDEAIKLGRKYNYDEMTVDKQSKDYIVVIVPTSLDGVDADVKLKLVLTENGWRLDSPTY